MLTEEQEAQMRTFRRWLHQHPETGYKEIQTGQYIRDFLLARGVNQWNIRTCAQTGFTVDIRGKGEASTTPRWIAFRADMDALPMDEENEELEYRSINTNVAHMSGHDGHMAVLTGFAWVLLENINALPSNCTVRLIYQPAEEGPGGATRMIQDGALGGVDEVYGFSNSPLYDLGHVFCPDNDIMAQSTLFHVTVTGKGGHGAYPQLNVDSLLAATQMATTLSSILGRNVSWHTLAAFTVCEIHSGSAPNVMPENAKFSGNMRDYNPSTKKTMVKRMKEIWNGIAKAMMCTVEFKVIDGYPATINHAQNAEYVRDAARRALGWDQVVDSHPSAASDDFSEFLLVRPGAFFFVGTGYKHMVQQSPYYDYNDETTAHVVKLYSTICEDRMGFSLL